MKKSSIRSSVIAISAFFTVSLLISGNALAADFTIANGDVAALAAAINSANATPAPDTINLAPGGLYTLTASSASDGFWGSTGLPPVTSAITIEGHGATIERSSAPGTPDFRILLILQGDVVLQDVTIRGGSLPAFPGGGIAANNGTLRIRQSTIAENHASDGGGIYSLCTQLDVENSTISYNTGFGGRTGGGILNFSSPPSCVATTTISNSTVFENQAGGPPGFEGRGDNIADAFSPAGVVVLKNSIVASPTRGLGSDCMFFTPDSRGHNIFSDDSCGSAGVGDRIVPSLALEALADNGGLTPTHAPLACSPPVDAIPLADCTNASGTPIVVDQRGIGRPQGSQCDIGSFEREPVACTPPQITAAVTGPLGANGWYRGDVTVSWTTIDAETPITATSGCEAVNVTSDTAGVTFTCSATSPGGTASESATVKRDATAPEISVAVPADRASFLVNQAATVAFACRDALSGVGSCAGTIASGTPLPTTAIGVNAFNVTAIDNAGNQTTFAGTYNVVAVVSPIFDQTRAYKSGSTIPIKIRLVDANGANVSSPSIVVHAAGIVQTSTAASASVEDAGDSNPGSDFRYDDDVSYIFNLKTTGFGTGTYALHVGVDGSPTTQSVVFQVRQ